MHGWAYKETADDIEFLGYGSWFDKDGRYVCLKPDYNPLAKTQAGKAQCFELVEEFDVWISSDSDGQRGMVHIASCSPHTNNAIQYGYSQQRAIVLAVVASKYGDTIECDGGEG